MFCYAEPVMALPQLADPDAPALIHYRKPVRGSLVWWLRFCGVAAFIVVLVLQLPKAQDVHLVRIDLRWLGFCMLVTIGQLLLEAGAWHALLSAQRIRHPYPKTLVAYLASQYLGLVTPGHVGEFLAAGYISMNTGITFGYALSSVVMKKVISWLTVLSFGVWGLPLLAELPFLRGVQQMAWVTVVVLATLLGGIAVWVLSLQRLAKKWQRLSPWKIDVTEFWAGMRQLGSVRLVVPVLLGVSAFSCLFVEMYAVLRAMGVGLSFELVSRIMALSRIAARLVPFSVVGFGSKDAAVIMLLAQHRVDYSVGLTAALLFLLSTYLLTLLLSGLCWWIKPLVVRRTAPASS